MRVTLYLRGTEATTSLCRYHMTPAKSPSKRPRLADTHQKGAFDHV